jgi:hypothetical protein
MMFRLKFASLALLAGTFAACTANIHDNTVNIDATVNVTADIDTKNIAPGQAVPVKAAVTNVYLVEPSAAPPAEHIKDAAHLQYYIDDTASTAVLVTAQVSASVKIPADIKAGNHKIICRVHKHDGTPTTTVSEINITVVVSVTTGGSDAGSTSDGAAHD